MTKEEFKEIRESINFSQEQLGQELRKRTNKGSRSYVAKIEKGEKNIPAYIAGAMMIIKSENKDK